MRAVKNSGGSEKLAEDEKLAAEFWNVGRLNMFLWKNGIKNAAKYAARKPKKIN